MKEQHQSGFIVVEILIAGLILTTSIAATMYLFRMGFEYLERANQSNVLSSKLTQVSGLIKTLDLSGASGEEDLGEGATLKWKAKLLSSSRPAKGEGEVGNRSLHELFLYRVNFTLQYKELVREYEIHAFRHKPLYSPEEISF